MFKSRPILLLIATSFFLTSARLGEASALADSLRAGDQVRVTTASDRFRPRKAQFVTMTPDSLTVDFQDPQERASLSLASITRLESFHDTKSKILPGAVAGLMVGLVAGGAMGYATDPSWSMPDDAGWLAIGALGGLALGTVIGAIASDDWDTVDFDED